jgi:hypothetical protein
VSFRATRFSDTTSGKDTNVAPHKDAIAQQHLVAIDGTSGVAEEQRSPPRAFAMNFLEGTRIVTADELRDKDITRYQVTKFYEEQIKKSGYYEQLKHIVEPSFKEFESPGALDTSGEADNTVVPGLQHK